MDEVETRGNKTTLHHNVKWFVLLPLPLISFRSSRYIGGVGWGEGKLKGRWEINMFLVGDKVLEIWEKERGHGESSSVGNGH